MLDKIRNMCALFVVAALKPDLNKKHYIYYRDVKHPFIRCSYARTCCNSFISHKVIKVSIKKAEIFFMWKNKYKYYYNMNYDMIA